MGRAGAPVGGGGGCTNQKKWGPAGEAVRGTQPCTAEPGMPLFPGTYCRPHLLEGFLILNNLYPPTHCLTPIRGPTPPLASLGSSYGYTSSVNRTHLGVVY